MSGTRVRLRDGRVVIAPQMGMTEEQLNALPSADEAQQASVGAPPGVEFEPDDISSAPRLAGAYYGASDPRSVSGLKKFAGGAYNAVDRAAMGLKDLFTDLTPDDRARLEQGKAAMQYGGAATAGTVATEIPLLAFPEARGADLLMRGARMIGGARVPAFVRGVGEMTSHAASGGATTAALSPEDRGGAFIQGSLGAGAGELVGRGAAGFARGLFSGAVSPEAMALEQRGVTLPLWSSLDPSTRAGRFGRGIADRARVGPIGGAIMADADEAALRQWNDMLVHDAAPPTPVRDAQGNVTWQRPAPINAAGTDAVEELARRYNDAYDAVYSGQGVPASQVLTARSRIDGVMTQIEQSLPVNANEAQGTWATINGMLQAATGRAPQGGRLNINVPVGTHADGRALTQALRKIDQKITDAYNQGKGELADYYRQMRDEIDDLRAAAVPPQHRRAFLEVQGRYGLFKDYQRAMSKNAAQVREAITPNEALMASRQGDRSGGKVASARGNAGQLQDEALVAQRLMGSTLPRPGPGTAEKLVGPMVGAAGGVAGVAGLMAGDMGATLALATPQGRRFLTGRYPWQPAVADWIRQYGVPATRGAGLSIAYDDEDLLNAPRYPAAQ